MKTFVLAAALSLAITGAYAQGAMAPAAGAATCKTNAKGSDGKMLAGAALTAYMKKCQTDATKACDDKAAAQKLSGAAKASFTKKCVADSVG
jgi:hypothetical protein